MTGAKLIVSSRYLKSGTAKNTVKRKNYTRYIATRETVELREQQKISVDGEVTDRQRELLAELLSDFPEAKSYLEYQDYTANPTGQNASELIGTIMERNADLIGSKKSLVGYMAMRPGAERRGEHGLFNGSDDPIVLNQAADEVAYHKGNVWSHVVSLRREDAVRLGYDNSDRWRELVKRHISDLAAAHKIPLSHLKWYAAFHDTAHHPHIHLLVYSTNPGEGFLSKKGIESIRSVFANDIFHDDLQSIYQEQTASRDRIRAVSAEEFSEMVRQTQCCNFQNPQLEMLIRRLREQLKNVKGKKVYGYLPKAVKQTVDEIFTQLAGDERIKLLYRKWCELEKLKYQSYTMQEPELPDLQDNKVFKSVKNMIIRTVMQMEKTFDVAEPELFPSANEHVGTALKLLDGEDVDSGIRMLSMNFKPDSNYRKDGTNIGHHAYTCGTYKHGGAAACTSSHWILENVLMEIVQNDLEQYTEELRMDTDRLERILLAEYSKAVGCDRATLIEEQQRAAARIEEIDTMLGRLYEELLAGQLERAALAGLSERLKEEKTALECTAKQAQAGLDAIDRKRKLPEADIQPVAQ